MGYQPMIPVRCEKLDGSASITFGIAEYEFSDDQPVYTPEVPLPGTDYLYDQLGTKPAPKQSGHVPIRFLVLENSPLAVDAAVRALKRDIISWGLVKLIWQDSVGTEYFQYARAVARPGFRWKSGQIFSMGATVDFRTQSDLIALSAVPGVPVVDITEPITESPHSFDLSNPGASPILNAKIYLKGTWAGTSITPWKFANAANGYYFEWYEDVGSSPDDWVLFDCGPNRAYRSTNGGVDYDPMDSKVHRGPGQIQMMKFEPGTNPITITDFDGATVDAEIQITFDPGY